MEEIIDAIRAALAADATPEVRVRGADACRAIVNALEAKAGQPLAASRPPVVDPTQVAQLVGALRGMPPEQLLDLAIARLRAAVPAGAEVPRAKPIAFHLVPIPQPGGRK